MPLHVSSVHAKDGFKIWHFRAFSRGENIMFLLKRIRLLLLYAPWCTGPVAAFTINNACLFKYRMRESEIEQVPFFPLRENLNWKEIEC